MIKRLVDNDVLYYRNTDYSKIKTTKDIDISHQINTIFNSGRICCGPYDDINETITEIEFTNNLNKIEPYAFYKCKNLKKVVLSPTISVVANYGFNCNINLEEINLDNIITIGEYAFSGCDNLKEVNLPNTQFIFESAFAGSGIEKIKLSNNLDKIDNNTFRGCLKLKEIELPNNLLEIGNQAFHSCEKLSSIKIPDSVKYIGDYAFYKCHGLKEIIIPDDIQYIGELAFSSCRNLTKIIWRGTTFIDRVVLRDTLLENKVAVTITWF